MTAQMATMALESYSQLGNFNMGLRGAIPRSPILNNKSAAQALNGTFSAWSRQGRLQANALKQLDAVKKERGNRPLVERGRPARPRHGLLQHRLQHGLPGARV